MLQNETWFAVAGPVFICKIIPGLAIETKGSSVVRNPKSKQSSVLLLGNYRPTLTVASALAQMNFRVIITRDCGGGYAQFSRHVDECWDHPPLESGEAFYQALGDFLRSRPDISVVYPIWENCLRDLAQYQHLLPEDRLYAGVDAETVEICTNKPEMLKFAANAGVSIASYQKVSDYKSLDAAKNAIDFPLIIRPVDSRKTLMGKKALIVHSDEQLDDVLPEWPKSHSELIVQRYVTGPRINLYFAAQNGKPIRYLATEILETDVRDGTGFAVDGHTIELDHQARSIGDRLIEKLDYHGVGLIQFIRDSATNDLSFLELNPRVAGSHAVAEACGMELGRLTLDLARLEPQPSKLKVGLAGKRYVWTYGAVSSIYRSLKSSEIGPQEAALQLFKTMVQAVKAEIHMTWRWSDPMPTIVAFLNNLPLASRWIKKLSKQMKKVLPSPQLQVTQ